MPVLTLLALLNAGDICTTQNCAVYAETATDLYQIDPVSLTQSHLCTFSGVDGPVNDIAVDDSGTLYALTADELYTVNISNCASTPLASVSSSATFNGLSFLLDGRLIAVDTSGDVTQINPSTGSTSSLGNYGSNLGSSGDAVALRTANLRHRHRQHRPDCRRHPRHARSEQRLRGHAGGHHPGFQHIYGLGYWAGVSTASTTRATCSRSIPRTAAPRWPSTTTASVGRRGHHAAGAHAVHEHLQLGHHQLRQLRQPAHLHLRLERLLRLGAELVRQRHELHQRLVPGHLHRRVLPLQQPAPEQQHAAVVPDSVERLLRLEHHPLQHRPGVLERLVRLELQQRVQPRSDAVLGQQRAGLRGGQQRLLPVADDVDVQRQRVLRQRRVHHELQQRVRPGSVGVQRQHHSELRGGRRRLHRVAERPGLRQLRLRGRRVLRVHERRYPVRGRRQRGGCGQDPNAPNGCPIWIEQTCSSGACSSGVCLQGCSPTSEVNNCPGSSDCLATQGGDFCGYTTADGGFAPVGTGSGSGSAGNSSGANGSGTNGSGANGSGTNGSGAKAAPRAARTPRAATAPAGRTRARQHHRRRLRRERLGRLNGRYRVLDGDDRRQQGHGERLRLRRDGDRLGGIVRAGRAGVARAAAHARGQIEACPGVDPGCPSLPHSSVASLPPTWVSRSLSCR